MMSTCTQVSSSSPLSFLLSGGACPQSFICHRIAHPWNFSVTQALKARLGSAESIAEAVVRFTRSMAESSVTGTLAKIGRGTAKRTTQHPKALHAKGREKRIAAIVAEIGKELRS